MTAPDDDRDDGFLSRWARRKAALRDGRSPVPAEPPPAAHPAPAAAPTAPATVAPPTAAPSPAQPAAIDPPPDLLDVEGLTPASDFARFVRPDVDPTVGNAALKKLFADPRFNVIDDMDTDIMDYGKLETLPVSMLRRMTSARALGLFKDEEVEASAPAPADDPSLPEADAPKALTEKSLPDENAALRLQPDDAAGCEGDRPDLEDDAGGQR